MSTQDFTKRLIIVARKDLLPWQTANTIAHIAAYIGHKLGTEFGTGENFSSKDVVLYPRNSQYPIIIKRANSSEQLRNLLVKIRDSGLLYHAFIREMIDHTSDSDLQKALDEKIDSEIELLGIGIFGPNEEVATLTKKFGLWE